MNQQQTIDWIKKYTEDILTFFDLNVEVEVKITDNFIDVSIPSNEYNSLLIGHNAETLKSIQQIIVSGLHQKGAELTRINVDIADYKKQRAEKIADKARTWMENVMSSGEDYKVNLNPADRRIVHQVAGEFSEIETHSEGEGRNRVLIISRK